MKITYLLMKKVPKHYKTNNNPQSLAKISSLNDKKKKIYPLSS